MLRFLCFLILGTICFTVAGNRNQDQLLQQYKSASSDSSKIRIALAIGEYYKYNDTHEAEIYFNQALDIAHKIGDQTNVFNALTGLGNVYLLTADLNKAIICYRLAMKVSTQLKNRKSLSMCYVNLGTVYYYSARYDLATECYEQSLNIAVETKADELISKSNSGIGLIYYDKGDFKKALDYFNRALSIEKKRKNLQAAAECNINIGNVYYYSGEYLKASRIFHETLKFFEEQQNKKRVSDCLNNLGLVHQELKDYDEAIKYYKESAKLAGELNDVQGVAASWLNIGNVYLNRKNIAEGEKYLKQSLEKAKESGDNQAITNCINNLGVIYESQNMPEKAIEYYQQALEYVEQMGEKSSIATYKMNIGAVFIRVNKIKKGMDFLKESEALCLENGFKKELAQVYLFFSEAYGKSGDYKRALEFTNLYLAVNDSLMNESKQKQVMELKTKYETEKKQARIELQNSQLFSQKIVIKQQTTQKYAFIAGLLLVSLLGIVIWIAYRNKHKANILLAEQKQEIAEKNEELKMVNEEISSQRDEIEAQRDEIEQHLKVSEEQRELITHQKKELTDSINYAQRIQRAILPPSYFVNKCLPDSFIMYLPKDVVSGDFYYVEKLNEYVIFAAVDCTGHGVPGSMMSVIGYNLINQAVKLNHITKPSEILSFLDAGVTETLRQAGGESGVNDGMDIAVCTLNTETNLLQFAGAYNGIVYVKGKEMTEIKADNLAIGVNYDGVVDTYTNHEIPMDKGDVVYLYSNGFADQFGGPKGKKFKYKQLKDLLLQYSTLGIDEQKEKLLANFSDWKGDLEQVDDVMVIGLRIV